MMSYDLEVDQEMNEEGGKVLEMIASTLDNKASFPSRGCWSWCVSIGVKLALLFGKPTVVPSPISTLGLHMQILHYILKLLSIHDANATQNLEKVFPLRNECSS